MFEQPVSDRKHYGTSKLEHIIFDSISMVNGVHVFIDVDYQVF